MGEIDRVRWHCRRGLLELDLVLNDFVENHYQRLTPDQKAALTRLLDLPDNDLWDLVIGRARVDDAGCEEIVGMLR
jgi:antitoxin CptB